MGQGTIDNSRIRRKHIDNSHALSNLTAGQIQAFTTGYYHILTETTALEANVQNDAPIETIRDTINYLYNAVNILKTSTKEI